MNVQQLNSVEKELGKYQAESISYKDITSFLDTNFTYSEIQEIQTIMYIGRDFLDSEEFFKYNSCLNDYLKSLPWKEDKGIEIAQICGKQLRVSTYFKKGRQILNV